MPLKNVVAETTHQVTINTELLQHLSDAGKILGPFIAVIIGLLVWAWNRMEKTQDKLEKLIVEHVKENDGVHDQIFGHIRDTDKALNHLIGEHEATHGGK